MSKGYGLIVPGSKKEIVQPKANFTKPSIFGSDSDSDDAPTAPIRKTTSIEPGANEKRQARKIQEKALQEDPTIFQYDELYDDIETKRVQQKTKKNTEQRKPKYINRLLECAERRKIENERRLERMIQKEREFEGEQFKDKESFVTSAYRKKLEELRKAEEREKREEYLEAIGDVTKQQNLDGFYRHLYEQKLGKDEELENEGEKEDNYDDDDVEKIPDKSNDANKKQTSISNKIKSTKSRAYRKRKSSDEDEEESTTHEDTNAKKTHLQSNIDADSDFSIDSSSDSEDDATESNVLPVDSKEKLPEVVAIKQEPEYEFKVPASVNDKGKDKTSSTAAQEKVEPKTEIKSEPNDEKPSVKKEAEEKSKKIDKKDIWKKRTVGEMFEAALQRYYERKALRSG